MLQKCQYISFFFIVFSKLLFSEGTLFHIQGDSTDTDLLNFVFLAEGFTIEQEPAFKKHVEKLTDSLFFKSPYTQYKPFFNFWGIFVASAESGADHPNENITKNTYFDATFGTSTPWAVTFKNNSLALDMLSDLIPDFDIACLVVNDTGYGGTGGQIAVITLNKYSFHGLIHETGHSFAGLADEYETTYSISPKEMWNITAKTNRDSIKWNKWILPQTPVPTPENTSYSDVVGLFEGAMYQPTGWYRPKLQCIMRAKVPSFCEVCIEAHIYQIYSHCSPIKSFSPQVTSVVYSGNSLPFSVETHSPQPNTQLVSWLLDDQIISQNTKAISVTASQIKNGEFSIRAIVQDTTPLVRNPAFFSTLADTIQWKVSTGNTIAQQKIIGKDVFSLSATIKNNVVVLKNQGNYSGALNIAIFNMQGQRLISRRIEPGKYTGNKQCIYQFPVSGISAGTCFLSVSDPAMAVDGRYIKLVIY